MTLQEALQQLTPMQQIALADLKADFDAIAGTVQIDDISELVNARTDGPIQRLQRLRTIRGNASVLERLQYGLSYKVFKTKEHAQEQMNEWLIELGDQEINFITFDLIRFGIF
ncbi:hypothetical protein HNP12_000227 [Aeromonas hydrophila]|uniref:hypothetical protein n=1 Tax=Aeromonas hydrophila TaxID=644 RepID=UPI0021697FE4|nr:hypothetical protein [Aeromonas hydrophila]MCS3766188.1 hypothetical protein [Aeromonas hydrophila]